MASGTSLDDTAKRERDTSQDVPVGTMVGEYRVEGLLGEGGMGRVFAAVHPVIAKRAAIKVLHPELSVNRQAVERFVQEARAVNQIGHPNIVDIFSFGALPDGRCYFVMEHLRGESLRERIDRQLPPLLDSLMFLDTITIALEAAHEKSIIHRDLKPDNIFLVDVKGGRPAVKLLDFGIAKLLGTDDSRAQQTRTGNILGTPAYISPEQARGHGVDHRTDIYALGALAFELFTGQLPFPADSAADMIAKHLYQAPPSVRSVNQKVPLDLDVLVTRMLAKDSAERPTLTQVRMQLRASCAMVTSVGVDATISQQRARSVGQGMVTTILPEAQHAISLPQVTASMQSRRSRGWIYGLGATVVVAGVAIAIALGSSSGPAKQEAARPAAAREPAKAVTPEPAKPIVTPIPEPVEVAKPEPVEVVKPETASVTKPVKIEPKKPVKPIKPQKPRKPDDDDAPM